MITKTATRGKWIIDGKVTVNVSPADTKRSRAVVKYFREEKTINERGRIVTELVEKSEQFLIAGRGISAVQNIQALIEQGCFK